MNYPKKTRFNLYQSRHCAYITYSVKTWFLKILSVYKLWEWAISTHILFKLQIKWNLIHLYPRSTHWLIHSLYTLCVHIMLLYPIWSMSPRSGLVFNVISHFIFVLYLHFEYQNLKEHCSSKCPKKNITRKK